MSSIKLLLRKDKINQKGESPLYLRITKDRRSKYVSLQIRIKPEQWDEKKDRVRRSHPNSVRLNNYLQQKLAEASAAALEQGDLATFSLQRVATQVKDDSPVDFFAFFEQELERRLKAGKVHHYRKGKSVLKKLRKFWSRPTLPFTSISVSFLKSFKAHLQEVYQNKHNSILTDIKAMRKIYMDAIDEGLVGEENNPFTKFKMTWEETQKPYLTEEQLARVEQLPLVPGSNLDHHRNMFVFSTYVGGLRISDVLQLRWRNFTGTHIELLIQKTGNPLSIKVPGKALKILDQYQLPKPHPEAFIFPVLKLKADEVDPLKVFKAISSATAYTNKELKEIGKRTEIPFSFSFHTARHTWATRALRKGMRIEYVSKLMGHKKLKTTQVYAKIVSEELDKAMDVFED